jgi:hypothetical protein
VIFSIADGEFHEQISEDFISHGFDFEFESECVNFIIPNALLAELYELAGGEDITVKVAVTSENADENILSVVKIEIFIGGRIIDKTTSAFVVTIPLIFEGINSITAVFGEILIGGEMDSETMSFVFEAAASGEYTIIYNVRRLSLNINSLEIIDLADNSTVQLMDVFPTIQNGRVLIPIRFVAYALGVEVNWTPANENSPLTVTLTIDGNSLTFAIGETIPGMDVPAQIINGRTMVPLRFVSEFFGAVVNWHEDIGRVEIIQPI